ncbi:uncharacterized protein LOC143959271 [Lithobates pipiens]
MTFSVLFHFYSKIVSKQNILNVELSLTGVISELSSKEKTAEDRITSFSKALERSEATNISKTSTFGGKKMYNLKAFVVRRALGGGRRENEGEKKWKEAVEREEQHLRSQRRKIWLQVFNTKETAERRELKHQVVVHKIVNKVPSPCPEEMRHRIPSRAAERAEAEAQTKPCEAIVEQSIVPRVERTTIQEKKMESIKTVPEMSPLEKLKKGEKLKQTRICKKGLEQGLRRKMLVRHVFYTDQPVKRKATDVNELTPVIRKTKQLLKVFGPNDPEEEKQEEMCQKKATELQELDLAIHRTKHFLTLFNFTNREKRREIKHQVVAHRIINKVPSPCPEEMRQRIPSRAAERAEAEAQMKPCEAIVEQSIVPRVERTTIQETKMESIKTVPEMSPLEKLKKEEKLKQTKTCKKGLEQGLRRKMLVRHVFYTDQPVKRKATDVNELTPVIRKTKQLLKVFGTNDPEEEKQEEMCQKKATELQELDLAIHRTKHFLTLFKFTNREKRREIKHQVVAHKIINKVPSPCPEEMRHRIPSRAAGPEEAGAQLKRYENVLEWSNAPREEKKEVQKESLFRRFLKSFRVVKTSSSSETTKMSVVDTNQETKPCEAIVEQSIVPRVERTTIQEKKMESIKTVPEMSPLEKQKKEEKRKQSRICKKGLEQGLRRKMLVRHVFYTDQPVKRKATDVNELTPVIRKTKQLLKVFGPNDPEEEKQEEMCQKKATELQELDLAIHRTKHFLTLFNITNREKRREIKHQVVANKIIDKVPSPCPEEMRHRIPSRAAERAEAEAQTKPCEAIVEQSIVPRVERTTIQEKKMESIKTVPEMSPLEKLKKEEKLKQTKTCKKGLEQGLRRKMLVRHVFYTDQPVKRKATDVNELTPVIRKTKQLLKVFGPNDPEEEKQEEMCQKKAIELQELDLAIQRTKHFLTLFKFTNREKRREIKHQVVAHSIINKVPSPYPEEMRHRIPARAMEQEEEKIHRFKNIFEWSNHFSEQEKEVQSENLFSDKTSGRKNITKTLCLELKEAARQKKTWEKGKREGEMEEKMGVGEQMEKKTWEKGEREREGEMEEKKMGVGEQMEEKTNTFTEEEKRKVEEEVEWKKKNERKVKAMRDRIQRVKLYEKMTDTEDPEEKRKLMQRVIAHKMINKIGAPCTGQRRNSILVIAEEQEEGIQNKNLSNIKPSVREKITETLCLELKGAARQKKTWEKGKREGEMEEKMGVGEQMEKKTWEKGEREGEMEEKKMGVGEQMEEKTNTFTEEEKRKVEEEVEWKKKNERKVKAMRDRIQRVKLYEKMTDTEDPEEKRKLMQRVIAHKMINKIGAPCTGQRRNSILVIAEEQEEGIQNKNLSNIKPSVREKITETLCLELKEAAKQKKTWEKGKREGEMEEKMGVGEQMEKKTWEKGEREREGEMEEKKMGVGEQMEEKTNTFTEEEKRKVEEEVEWKKKNERKVKAMRDRIQRVKLYEKMTDTEDPEEKRKLMQRVIAHKMINKIGAPCTGQRRNSILVIAEEQEEGIQNKNLSNIKPSVREKITETLCLELKGAARQKKTWEKGKREGEMEEKMGVGEQMEKKTWEKGEREREGEMEEKKMGVGEQMEEKTNTFTEEEKRKVEEEVEWKKKNERKVKAMRDRIQRVKLYEKMTDTEDPEEKRKLMQRVIAHKMINKIGAPCTGQRRNSILVIAEEQEEGIQNKNLSNIKPSVREKITETLCLELKEAAKQKKTWEKGKREGEMEEKKMGVGEQMEKEKTNTFTEEEKRKVEEEVEWKKKNERKVKAMRDRIQRVKLYEKMTDTEDPEEKRKLMQRVIAHKMINKIGAPCTGQRRNSILVIAEEQEKEIQNKNLSNIKPSVREKITETLCLELKGAARQKKTWEKGEREGEGEMEGKKMGMGEQMEKQMEKKTWEKGKREGEMEEKKMGVGEQMEKEKTNTFTEEEKRKVEEEVEWKKKNERKVKAMRDRIQRVKLYEKMTDTEDPEEKRKLMQRVIAHKMINKIGAPCTGQRRNSILVIAEEEEKEIQNKNLSNIKPSVREKITETLCLELKGAAKQKKTWEKGEREGEMEGKKMGVGEQMEKEKTNTFTEEEKRKVEEEVEWKKKNERKVKAMRDRIQRVKLYEKMTDTEDPEEKRKLMQRVIAHKMINKIGAPCTGQRRNSILVIAEEQEEGIQNKNLSNIKPSVREKITETLCLELKGAARQKKTWEKGKREGEMEEKMGVGEQMEKKTWEKGKREREGEMEEKKMGVGEQMEKEKTNTFTEEEKRKVEEEVEWKKKNERKVKAMRDRIQRVKLYEKMTDTEDPEEKRKLMQRVIAHKMINKIGAPCTGQRRNSILVIAEEQEEGIQNKNLSNNKPSVREKITEIPSRM